MLKFQYTSNKRMSNRIKDVSRQVSSFNLDEIIKNDEKNLNIILKDINKQVYTINFILIRKLINYLKFFQLL